VTADPKTIPPASVSDSTSASESNQAGEFRGDDLTSISSAASASSGWRVWLQRSRALLFVTLCATFGVLLVILPWTPRWTDNPLLLSSSALRDFVSSGFVRGFASGLGLLDLWLGFREAILYHEHPHGSDN
jgi:hypothetical protein